MAALVGMGELPGVPAGTSSSCDAHATESQEMRCIPFLLHARSKTHVMHDKQWHAWLRKTEKQDEPLQRFDEAIPTPL